MPLLRQGPSSSFLLAVAASLVVCIQQLQTAEAGTIGGSKVRCFARPLLGAGSDPLDDGSVICVFPRNQFNYEEVEELTAGEESLSGQNGQGTGFFRQNYFRRTPKASVNVNVAGSRQLPRLY